MMSSQANTPTEQPRQRIQPSEDRSIGGLIKELMQEFTALVRNEAELAKSEVSEKVSQVQTGIISLASAVVLLLIGLIGLMYGAIFGLAQVPFIPLWLSALIVGGVIVLIGVIALAMARSKLQARSFKPQRSANELQKDSDFVRGQAR